MVNKYITIFLFSAIIFSFVSCKDSKPNYKSLSQDEIKIDSFTVIGNKDFVDGSMFLNFVNDSIAITLEGMQTEFCLLKRQKTSNNFQLIKKERLSDDKPISFLLGQANDKDSVRFYISSAVLHKLNTYNTDLVQTSSKYLSDKMPYFGNKYFLFANLGCPAIMFGDTLVSTIMPMTMPSERFKGNFFHKFKLTKDSLLYLDSFGKPVANSDKYYMSWPNMAWKGRRLFMLYPMLDTIFSYDINTGKEKKIAIHNQDYTKPSQWKMELSDRQKSNYFSDLTKYLNENFRYLGIVINQNTGHFILTYQKPIIQEDKSKLPIPDERPIYLIVLDKDGTVLKYFKLEGKEKIYYPYLYPVTNGIAIPRFQKDINNENRPIQFDVFNL